MQTNTHGKTVQLAALKNTDLKIVFLGEFEKKKLESRPLIIDDLIQIRKMRL